MHGVACMSVGPLCRALSHALSCIMFRGFPLVLRPRIRHLAMAGAPRLSFRLAECGSLADGYQEPSPSPPPQRTPTFLLSRVNLRILGSRSAVCVL